MMFVIDRDTFKELYDPTLPAELLSLFQPLFCKLCMFQLSGNSMAKLHYQSKNHDKKVRAWLIEYSERTGEPLHKRAAVPRTKRNEVCNFYRFYIYCNNVTINVNRSIIRNIIIVIFAILH